MDVPKRRAITNSNKTNNRNANFATILLDSRNYLVPDKYLLDAKLLKPLCPPVSDTRENWELISIY